MRQIFRCMLAITVLQLAGLAAYADAEAVDYTSVLQTAERLAEVMDEDGLTAALRSDLMTFASLAIATATHIDETGGAPDLACIYRGMAADIPFRLENHDEGDPHARGDLRALLQDAIDITPRTQKEAEPIGPGSQTCQSSEAERAALARIFD